MKAASGCGRSTTACDCSSAARVATVSVSPLAVRLLVRAYSTNALNQSSDQALRVVAGADHLVESSDRLGYDLDPPDSSALAGSSRRSVARNA